MNHDEQAFPQESAMNRRSFIKYMGASSLLYGLVLPACRRSNQYLVPYNNSPEWSLPGTSTAYSTCMPHARGAVPMLAICREGRPIRLEPQPWLTESPGLSASAQATLLGLYDPNRSKDKLFYGKPANEDEFKGAFSAWARGISDHGKVAFVFDENDSPLRQQMVDEIRRKNPNARFFSYEPFSSRNIRKATEHLLGEQCVQIPVFKHARRVVSFDCDFLASDIQGYTGDFMKGKIPEEAYYQNSKGDYRHLTRLYMAEGRFSLTGGMADERLAIIPSQIPGLIWALAHEIELLSQVNILHEETVGKKLPPHMEEWVKQCAGDLFANQGQSLILLGSQYPQELHQLVLSINTALNANGITLRFLKSEAETYAPLSDLLPAIDSREIQTLFILCSSNPLVDSPIAAKLKHSFQTPGLTTVRLGLYNDETTQACTWHIPAAHYLESWGIERDRTGRYCYTQPVITPLFGGVSEAELLNGLLHSKGILSTSPEDGSSPSPAYMRAKKLFDRISGSTSEREAAWADALRNGHSTNTAFARIMTSPAKMDSTTLSRCKGLAELPPTQEKEWELQIVPDYSIEDGRYSYNSWLQECPDPITGVCWGGTAQISAASLTDLPDGTLDDKLGISHPKGKESFTKTTVPGMADRLIVLTAGYGTRTAFNAQHDHSANAFAFSEEPTPFIRCDQNRLSSLNNGSATAAVMPPVLINEDELPVPLLNTRTLDNNADDTINDPAHRLTGDSLHQWGMNIDLSLCIGCNACLIACQAENNIPTVGPAEIAAGRSMHWIRIDRYFVRQGDATSSPVLISHPVACQQCENAPCESVCPVNATTHTSEGISAMVYPRCWGTRYCSANCPYKARRFNFFDYAKASDEEIRLQRNPHVTVRSRGVMEKCTFCVQKIEDAKIRHKATVTSQAQGNPINPEDLRLPPNAVKTACQLACPANAITFGNLLQKDTLNNAIKSPRNHTLIKHLGTRPRTSYLSKVIHPNSEQSNDHQN